MLKAVQIAEKAIGSVYYRVSNRKSKRLVFRRYLFIVEDIKVGELLKEANISSTRPACGLHPKYLKDVLGKQAKRDMPKGTPYSWNLVY